MANQITWNCRDKMSGEQFEVRGHDDREIIAAIEDYICSGIDADTGSVQYAVTCTAGDGSERYFTGIVEPIAGIVEPIEDERDDSASATPRSTSGWCRVCGDGLALDASNAHHPSGVCASCKEEGFTGAEGDDVRRATSRRRN